MTANFSARTAEGAPDAFPVTWESPDDAGLSWRWDQKHMPGPISPLGMDLCRLSFDPGMTRGMQAIGQPVSVRSLRLNTFLYQAWDDDFPRLPAAVDAIQRATFERAVLMPQRWEQEFQPEVEAASSRLLGTPYPRLSNAELNELAGWTIAASERMWEIHGSLMFGWHITGVLTDLCARLLGFSEIEALELIQGEHNLSVEAASRLWHLAQEASAPVRDAILSRPGAEVYVRLPELEGGRAFFRTLREYVAAYGWRKDNFDIADKSWAEEPWRALDSVRLMLLTELDPAAGQRRQAQRAEARLAEALARLAANRDGLEEFMTIYDLVKHGPRLQENHNLVLDQKFLSLARLPFVEAGQRMAAAGVLAHGDDVIYLTVDEIRAFLDGDTTPRGETAHGRREEMERWRGGTPPALLGGAPPERARHDLAGDDVGAELPGQEKAGGLRGLPAAPGVVSGTARVVRLLSEAERIQAGDILVCDMTTPAWTPLFPALGGIVADTGGALSHCAVMAREYGVPCVVGTKVGTRVIPDGARISVDGGSGVVSVDSPASGTH
ncbi:MAG TPA: PEP-utilizing enzyme [Dehalococcoidia bacterium]|nr:PEP-utilizing enzyme [Dehalococcoidia bacterium]